MAVEQERLLTIQQASELTGLTAHTLRYYERIDLLAVERAPNGHRRYDQQDIERLLFLNYLRLTGMPLEQMKQYAALHAQDEAGILERVRMLQAHRAEVARQVEALQMMLGVIDYKLALLTNKANDISEE
jgi:DNA-binding transcriptional MerR regulator